MPHVHMQHVLVDFLLVTSIIEKESYGYFLNQNCGCVYFSLQFYPSPTFSATLFLKIILTILIYI